MKGELQETLFDELEAAPPEAPPALSPTEVSVDTAQVWPRGTPGPAIADSVLRGTTDVPESLRELTVRAIQMLPSDLDPGAETLRSALNVLWRAWVAQTNRPVAGAPLDPTALDALLNEMDAALQALGRLNTDTDEQRAQSDGMRSGLAQCAVEFSEIAQANRQQGASAAAEQVTKRYRGSVARVVSLSKAAEEGGLDSRQRRLFIALGVVAVSVGSFHAYRLTRHPPEIPREFIVQAPKGMMGMREPRTGVVSLHPVSGQPIDANALTQFKTEAEAAGKRIVEPSPGHLLVLPSNPASAPGGPK